MSRLRDLRIQHGYKSQSDLAKVLFVNQTAVSQWERGVTVPSPQLLLRLSSLYGVTTDYLLGKDDPTVDVNNKSNGLKIPVLGDVAAGIPIEAVEDIVDYEEIDAVTASTGEFFGLRLKGASMEPRMREGDVVIVRKQSDAETGDTVVVLINGNSATVKRMKKSETGITLIPNNPAYDPMYFSNDDIQSLPVRVIGKVVELRAKF